ncbi:MAG: hypothetical protein K6F68_06365 [Clostridiales bacterium]|nr:hypothetical protein [Clostridiales bacterium]
MRKKARWFSLYRRLVGLFTSRPRFVYLGEKVSEPSVILSNHEAAAGPLTWERYFDMPKRFWAAHEMTEGVRSVFRYLAYYYFPDKKHFNKAISKFFAFFASPFVSLYYRGLKPIATFRDALGFVRTIRESRRALDEGESVILFPEDSSKGYSDRLKSIHSGFAVFCERMLRRGRDLNVVLTYFSRKKRTVLIDRPFKYSELRRRFGGAAGIAEAARRRINQLADIAESA